jgi:hypothetical protein
MEGAGVSPPTTEGINAPTPDRKKVRKILMAIFGSLARVFIRYLALLNENERKFGMEKEV